jgi:tetratricopeptide (TPR) repeat protein
MLKTVFLSSTSKDLAPYRDAAYQAIEGLDGYHCVRMEDFGARTLESDDFCREKVRECDLFIGIVGLLYGSEHESGKSFTEREYEAAVQTNKPRLIFVAPDDFPVAFNLVEKDAKREKQELFRAKVNQESVRDTFNSPQELATNVIQALRNWERRSDTAESLPMYAGGSLHPLPPAPHFAHPYPLQSNFTGRSDQRRLLTDWFLNDSRPVIGLIAIGGMGKSSLTWAWVQKDVLGLDVPGILQGDDDSTSAVPAEQRPVGVLWWSFYEQEARFQAFLHEAILYVSRGQVQPEEIQTQHDRVRMLVSLLREERFLVVLDGFERELRGALEEDELGDLDGAKISDVRTVIDIHAANFLKWAAAGPLHSRILFTSRLFPRDLDDVAGARREALGGLGEEETVSFFAAHKIRGTRAEIYSVAAPYGYHPLALRLLAGIILHDLQNPGDAKVALEYDPVPELVPRTQHILEWALTAAGEQPRKLLSRISALRSPANFDTLRVVAPEEATTKLQQDLRELLNRNLLVQDIDGRFDMHSVVRRFAYQRLVDKADVHAQLAAHFDALPKPSIPSTLESARLWMELVHHQAFTDDAASAYKTFSRRLEFLLARSGAFQSAIELLEPIAAAARLGAEDRFGLLGSLAAFYGTLGMPRLAADTLKESSRLKGGIAAKFRAQNNLAVAYSTMGEIRKADEILRQLLVPSYSGRDQDGHATACISYSHVLCDMGDFTKAAFYLSRISTFPLIQKNPSFKVQVLRASASRLVEMGRFEEASDMMKRAFEAHRQLSAPMESELVSIDGFTGWIHVGLAAHESPNKEEHLSWAEKHLTQALNRCRRIQSVFLEPGILHAWARWAFLHSDWVLARAHAEEGLAIARRSEQRLRQADLLNTLAQVEFAANNVVLAEEHARCARERAFCDGPPYYYKRAFDAAEEMLRLLSRR